nr:hypothetical protein HAGR004_35950 [Bdellovibrio sp. HAGR004]
MNGNSAIAIYAQLLNEDVDVWRPVLAKEISEGGADKKTTL